jgi:glyoxylase-like metal-dependent hydrolase (beta-lactamase superfamily II)
MKITNLTEDSKQYTANVYLVLGTWNTIDDINTLIDVGSDKFILDKIENINTGLGKRKIDQVILTHSHSDHSAILPKIKEAYNPRVCAFNSHMKGIDQILRDGNKLRIGEQQFEVFHITAHSYDSICLFGEEEGILFAGDTTFPIEFENEILKHENEYVLSRLHEKNIRTVYSGHGSVRHFSNGAFQISKNKIQV